MNVNTIWEDAMRQNAHEDSKTKKLGYTNLTLTPAETLLVGPKHAITTKSYWLRIR